VKGDRFKYRVIYCLAKLRSKNVVQMWCGSGKWDHFPFRLRLECEQGQIPRYREEGGREPANGSKWAENGL
jgi:hypothetical protein